MKKIRAKEQQQQKDEEKRMEYKVEVLDCFQDDVKNPLLSFFSIQKEYSHFIPGSLQDRSSFLFRPPSI